jgi:hypothetical protein
MGRVLDAGASSEDEQRGREEKIGGYTGMEEIREMERERGASRADEREERWKRRDGDEFRNRKPGPRQRVESRLTKTQKRYELSSRARKERERRNKREEGWC